MMYTGGRLRRRPSSTQGSDLRTRKVGFVTPAIVLLQERGIAFEVHEYDRGDDVRDFGREAAESLGLPFDQVFKTLLVGVEGVLELRDPVVVVVPVSCMVSMKLVAAAVGAKKATMCDPAFAERVTGYVVGGISPLGQRKRLTTLLDETVELFEMIYVSGGRRGLDIALAPHDLARLLDAAIVPITA
jgi:Cys-tRNA(Pro)/Cys-tRNA(Cys) deacylase